MDFVMLALSRKWGMLAIVFACGAFAFGTTYLVPQTFRAESMMLPPDRMSSYGLLTKLNSGFALDLLKEVENPSVDLLQNILESRSLSERLARDSTIHRFYALQGLHGPEIVEAVESALKVEPGFTKVTVKGTVETGWMPSASEKEQARVLSSYITNLAIICMDSTLRSAIRSLAHSTRVYADSDYALKRRELDSLDGVQEAFEQAHGVVILATQTQATLDRVAELRADRDQAEIELHLLSMDLSNDAVSKEAALAKLHAADEAANAYETEHPIGPALDSLPEVNRDYAELLRNRKQLEPIVAFLRVEAEQQSIFEVREKSMVTVLDTALTPDHRISPIRSQTGLVGLLFGIAMAILYLSFWSLRLSWTNEQDIRRRSLSEEASSARRIFGRTKA
jgi:tyrosine-protein kinase Etk/Wzc